MSDPILEPPPSSGNLPELCRLERADILGRLRQAASDGHALDVMVDTLVDASLIAPFFYHPKEYTTLYLQTRLQELVQLSPYLWRVETAYDAFLASLVEKPASGWGWIAVGRAPLAVCAAHWRSLLEVFLPNGKRTLFRFHDGTVMARILPACTREEQAALLGPCTELYVADPARESGWLCVTRADRGTGGEDLAGSFTPRTAPWWRVTEAQLVPFADNRERRFRRNLVVWLWENHFQASVAMDARYGELKIFVEKCLDEAAARGFTTYEQRSRYTAAVLYLELAGEKLPNMPETPSGTVRDPESALKQLETAAARMQP